MDIGIFALCTDKTLRPDEVAVLVEEAGFDALHLGEHTHLPAKHGTTYDEATLHDWAHMPDLLIALTAAALSTTRLRVSSAIIQLAHRDPIVTAKEVATIDFLSKGRIDLVVGHGVMPDQTRNHGVDPESKYEVVRERMLAMREIWQHDEASFHGDFVKFDSIWSWPKPVQASGVPLYYGGNSPGAEDSASDFGDGWAPLALPGVPDRIRAFKAAGVQRPVIAVEIPGAPVDIEDYADAGTDRLVLRLGSIIDHAEAERSLEVVRRRVDELHG